MVGMSRESQAIHYSINDSDLLRIRRLIGHIYTDDPVIQHARH